MSRIREFTMPDLGEGLTEGEILRWLVAVGDTITLNQPIVEVETAKAAVEIPAKWAGLVSEIFHGEGETVEVGAPIIAIDTDPVAGSGLTGGATSADDGGPPSGAAVDRGRTPVLVGYGPRTTTVQRRPRRVVVEGSPPVQQRDPAPQQGTNPVLAKPPVRKVARDLGIDLHALTGTGPQGSITRDDVEQAVRATAAPVQVPATTLGQGRERRVPVKGVRRLTADNMVTSAFTAPHVTEFLTVDVSRSVRALDRLRASPEWEGVRVSPLLLAAKAVLMAIGRHPMVNATWAGDAIVVKDYVNLGIAAATDRGLIVPNIKDAGALSLRELADAMTALVGTAKAGRTQPADMSGGTFTITNVGVFGIDTGTPILPPGEAAILAFGAVRQAPWAHRGKVRIRRVTTLGLSFDHRIIDGELGSKFLRDVGNFLTDPGTTLLAWG